jgi:hypothetical protein
MSHGPDTTSRPAKTALPLVRRIPLIGYLSRITDEERVAELGLFTANVLMASLLLVVLFGLPAFVLILYGLVALVSGLIVATTL